MKIVRWFLAGLAFCVISQIVGGIIYGAIFPHWYDSCEEFFRPMSSPYFQMGLPLLNLFQGLLLAAIYSVLYYGIPGKNAISKGSIYGLLLWLAGPLPGVLSQFCVTVLRFPLPCLIFTFVSMVVGGLVIGSIFGKSLEKQG